MAEFYPRKNIYSQLEATFSFKLYTYIVTYWNKVHNECESTNSIISI